VVEDRGARALKGIEHPVQLYRVIAPSGVRGRLEAAAATRGLTPFVGREDELRLLMNRWEHVVDGEGQVALIIGEAGSANRAWCSASMNRSRVRHTPGSRRRLGRFSKTPFLRGY
jgi:hypothetical protein